MHKAAAHGDVGKLRKLLDKGKDVNMVMRDDEGSYFTPLVSAVTERQAACVQMLLECGAHADGKGTNVARPKITPLMLACMLGDAECTYALVKHGATLNAADPDGFAPLHHACHAGHADCVKILLAAQADRTRLCGSYTALELAQNQGHAACAASRRPSYFHG